jgi:pimeloyl-ACP methyl ester carboxylesterase
MSDRDQLSTARAVLPADVSPQDRIVFAPDVPLRHVTVDGTDIAYRVWEGNAPDRPGLLFVHGFRAHARWWDHIIPFFMGEYRIATIDLGGCGDSQWRKHYTLAGFAREILAVIHAAKLTPATVVAHSFGGSPTAYACAEEPDAIKRAVIIDSRMFLREIPRPQPHEIAHLKFEKKSYPDLPSLLMRYRLLPTSGPVAQELLNYIARHSTFKSDTGWSWKFDPVFHPELPDDPNRVIPPGITTPIDYIYGEQSDVVSPALVDIMAKSLPTCGKPIVIPHSNHHVLLEQPDSLTVALRALFSRDVSTGTAR